MSVIFATGSDLGRVPSATGNAARRYVDAATGLTVVDLGGGDYVAQMSGTSTINNYQLTSNMLGTPTALVASFKVRFPTSLPSTSPDFCVVGATGGQSAFVFYQNSGTRLGAAWGGGATINGPVVVANTQYTVEVRVDTSANPNVLDWWVDGVAQTSTTIAQAAGTVNGFFAGRDSAATGTYQINDMRVSVTYADAPLGVGRVRTLVPSGTATEIGTANSICRFTSNGSVLDTTFNSADIMAAISEVPPVISASASGLYQRTSGVGNAVSIPMSNYTLAAGETIELCTIRVLLWSASTLQNALELRAWDGTAETVLIALEDPNGDNSTTTPAWWCATYTPSGGWTQAKLDALEVRIGYSNDVSPVPGAHQITAEISVKASTGGTPYTQSVSGSVTPTGALRKASTRTVAGSTTPSGSLRKATTRTLAGSTTPTGAMTRSIARQLTGAVTPTGLILRALSRVLGGSTTPTGAVTKATTRTLTGSSTPAGGVAKQVGRALAGSTTPTGSITRSIGKSLEGSSTATGGILRLLSRILGGTSTPTGDLTNDMPPGPALVLTVGPPTSGWATGAPDAAWSTDPPTTAWATQPPTGG